MRRATALLLAIAALQLSGCGGGAPPATPTPGAAGVDGRTFIASQAQGVSLVPGSEVRISFAGGSLAASAGCNGIGGEYRIEDGTLVTEALSTTDMACAEPLMAQESWFAKLLGDRPSVALAGDTLTVTGRDSALTLLDRSIADPDRPLQGTRWLVDGFVANGTASSMPAGVEASLVFGDGTVAVDAGCNRGSGTARVEGDVITFGPVALTKMACEAPRMAVEAQILEVLAGKVGYAIEAGALRLGGGNGPGLTLRAAPTTP